MVCMKEDEVSNAEAKTVECSGKAAVVLKAYRDRVFALKEEGRSKPDMIAFKELRQKWTPDRVHGELDGVPAGLQLQSRGEIAVLGIHQKILRGIDSVAGESCYAVCISGGYVDNDDQRIDGTIYYTGEGGRRKGTKVQIKDQDKRRAGNKALLNSMDSGVPIRVVCGRYGCYHYLGLYRCVRFRYQEGIHGKKVLTFELIPTQTNAVGLQS